MTCYSRVFVQQGTAGLRSTGAGIRCPYCTGEFALDSKAIQFIHHSHWGNPITLVYTIRVLQREKTKVHSKFIF